MKITTKSSMALIALLSASTIGATIVSADAASEAAAKQLDSKGTVIVGDSTDTKDPKEYGIDPETTKGKLYTIDGINFHAKDTNKGPIKLERTSNFNFGNIEASASDIVAHANPLVFDKQKGEDGNVLPEGDPGQKLDRGAIVQFADTRTEKYGYKVKAKMSEQFTLEGKTDKLDNSTITFNNAIIKSENVLDADKIPTYTKGNLVLKEDGNLVEFASADATKQAGKGRFALEFGQGTKYDKDLEGVDKTGKADTAKESVTLTVPNKTASDMKKGTYNAKVTWVIDISEN
ncbi:WxL domain-containing protein [Vagococcus sp.]|uniref:WxL domain-containing protein n=1 Tax=Vagococcus sp. TaxID=1933889 RepID=UPI002FC872EC